MVPKQSKHCSTNHLSILMDLTNCLKVLLLKQSKSMMIWCFDRSEPIHEVSTRELTFIAGASGSGKSVLCRLAVGLLRPEAGTVTLFGARVDTQPERALVAVRRRAPYLVQGPVLLDWRTLRENVRLADPTAPDEAVATALEQVGLKEWADRLPPELGPGAKKRAAIARALVLKPRYLLLDEPTTGTMQSTE